MIFEVNWVVEGTSVVEVDDIDIAAAGIRLEEFASPFEAFAALNKHYKGDLLNEAVEDFDERDAPRAVEVNSEDW